MRIEDNVSRMEDRRWRMDNRRAQGFAAILDHRSSILG